MTDKTKTQQLDSIEEFFNAYKPIKNVIAKLSERLDKLTEQLVAAKENTTDPEAFLKRASLEGEISNTKRALESAKQEYAKKIEDSAGDVLELFNAYRKDLEQKAGQKNRDEFDPQIRQHLAEAGRLIQERQRYYNQEVAQTFNAKIKAHTEEIPTAAPFGTRLIDDLWGKRDGETAAKQINEVQNTLFRGY